MVNQRLKKALESHTVSTLKKEVSKAMKGLGGASKMKKTQLINHMLSYSSLFSHIKIRRKMAKKYKPRQPDYPYSVPRPPATKSPVTGRQYTKSGALKRLPVRRDAIGLSNFGLGLSGGMMSRAQISKRLGQTLRKAYNISH